MVTVNYCSYDYDALGRMNKLYNINNRIVYVVIKRSNINTANALIPILQDKNTLEISTTFKSNPHIELIFFQYQHR